MISSKSWSAKFVNALGYGFATGTTFERLQLWEAGKARRHACEFHCLVTIGAAWDLDAVVDFYGLYEYFGDIDDKGA